MSSQVPAFRGPLLMLAATGSYVANDTMMKVATADLPPFEVLVLRGLAACIWGFPLLVLAGFGGQAAKMFDGRVLLRNLMETGAILTFIVALAKMPIADITAIGQVTPLLVLVGSAIMFGDRIGPFRWVLIAIGFAGAVMVAQPGASGISVFAALGFANAGFCAARDLLGRRVASHVPGLVVAMSAVIVVLAAALGFHLATETWVMPDATHLALLGGAGLFLVFGHFFIFMAYRIGPAGAVAPFYYGFSVWAVLSGLVVFGQWPNWLAAAGMALVVTSGLAIVLTARRA